ncbi:MULTISPECIES: alkaline shock response membrane anchor protein AmaP [unclassified Frondihabitans]|uniref:alkaline shock response membrane anchor protein AmaP n=1 Tax=unclassified Frondihabitans TaxID=2626248 RepID=UPI000F93FFCF|nr:MULTISPECIES: alkaline shock response membrane anchor protein AmaP [unclassified Frondihabitans]RPE77621.1 hypothetical protein EDF37_0268 [Frondihabitans sp. PhB153]RPF07898.1 hypothetical protein EDF39_0269 [Frondihabitans sp. PhB161]
MTMTETTPTFTRKNEWEKLPGRTKIAPRALDRVVSAVTADALGVNNKKVSVDLNDDDGNLSLTVSAPIRVPSLVRIENEPGVVDRQGGPLLERAKTAQEQIRTRVQQLTGNQVARVIVKITGVDIQEERRVR